MPVNTYLLNKETEKIKNIKLISAGYYSSTAKSPTGLNTGFLTITYVCVGIGHPGHGGVWKESDSFVRTFHLSSPDHLTQLIRLACIAGTSDIVYMMDASRHPLVFLLSCLHHSGTR